MRLAGLLVALSLFTQGCLLDMAPAREPMDATWESHMLAGDYGTWFYSEKRSYVGPDKIESSPERASGTRYGITISDQSTLGGGGWSLTGGIVGRLDRPGASIELFGKKVTRLHGPKRMVTPQDHSYEFFLLVRPTGAQRGGVVKRWTFPYEELGQTVPPALERNLRARYTGLELENALARSKGIFVDGYLSFDEQSKTATVIITGLVRPFQERVDLSNERLAGEYERRPPLASLAPHHRVLRVMLHTRWSEIGCPWLCSLILRLSSRTTVRTAG
jgi:hypothetical protein